MTDPHSDGSSGNGHVSPRALRQHLEDLTRAGVTHLPRAQQRDAAKQQGARQRAGEADHEESSVQHDSAASFAAAATASLFDQVPAAPVVPPEERPGLLENMSNEVAQCSKCPALVACRTQTVFGVGDPNAELCFVGEAPGRDEDAQGEPFVGRAGQLLNRIIAACKMKRNEVYICNILKCRPPDNRTPLPDEVANCRPFLDRQLEIIRPKFICALGGVAAQSLLQVTSSMARLRGRFYQYAGAKVICTYHPAYLLRNPAAKAQVWDDMKMLMQAMGRPVQ
jgi:uracil-DNA glycosylase family 4